MADVIGLVITGTKPDYVEIITEKPQSVGTYVNVLHQDGDCLGLIESSVANSAAMNQDEMTDWKTAKETSTFARKDDRDIGYRSYVKIVGYIDSLKGKNPIARIPSIPPNPSTEVHEVEIKILEEIFSPEAKKWGNAGNLLRSDTVSVKIDIDEVVSRHLAILSMTGMGKSNFVTVLSREVTKLKGNMVIFDYHNDYDKMQLQDENGTKISVNHIDLQIKPSAVDADQFADLIDIPIHATHQRELLQSLLTEELLTGSAFWDNLENAINHTIQDPEAQVIQPVNVEPNNADVNRQRREIITRARGLLPRIRRARRYYSSVIDSNALEPRQALNPGRINILNASRFNEKQADIALAYYLNRIFEDRKDAVMSDISERSQDAIFNSPVLFVIEEAHTFIRQDAEKTGKGDTKDIADRIAKEARKFGLGLCIVSQRPAKVNEDILSQMGSFAVLKLIQEKDRKVIVETSEHITENLARSLSTLNNGEALFTGRFVKIPTLAKIDDATKLKGGRGSDISATEGWERDDKMRKRNSSQDLIDKEDL